ncbi:MAG: alpha,alpha-trehalase nth1 [Piccolia ochrophora]|nr:MAG: alpha,alpha-trehalase nth1 [Piccolia ochrophora]
MAGNNIRSGARRGSRICQVSVNDTLDALLAQEDTDHNMQITIDDKGPKKKVFLLRPKKSNDSEDSQDVEVKGSYRLANLLEELVLAQEAGHHTAIINEKSLNENPVDRLRRKIKDMFWHSLTRRLDASLIGRAAKDPKDALDGPRLRIYVPFDLDEQYTYYKQLSTDKPEMRLKIIQLPEGRASPEYMKSLNNTPGILALQMEKNVEDVSVGDKGLRGLAFIVPGGRFNELYGWDSYFMALGLLELGQTSVVKDIMSNFSFEIDHYGMILNANRTYFLCRSQPPFLTDLALRTYEKIKHEEGSLEFLRKAILAAIKEYNQVWMSEPRFDPVSGLSRYRPEGLGIPPEVEEDLWDHIVPGLARRHNMTKSEFTKAYNDGEVSEPELDEYLLHDRAVRESGHDTSYRLENVAADLATVDLNCLLYKYETDISHAIRTYFSDDLPIPTTHCKPTQTAAALSSSTYWSSAAETRQSLMNTHLWDATTSQFQDYNTKTRTLHRFESATTLYPLWCRLATPTQASAIIAAALPALECAGGLASTSAASTGTTGPDRPQRQWDYPFGWAPHQMLAWDGLRAYGHAEEAKRLAYRWLYMLTKVSTEYGGAVVEKYDVESCSCKVEAEYGNQGRDFKGVAREGFGWTNASYTYGLSVIDEDMRRAVGELKTYEEYVESKERT